MPRRLDRVAAPAAALTVGQALEEWFASRAHTIGPNTARDYRLAIHHQLKPFKFSPGAVAQGAFLRPAADPATDERCLPPRHLGGPARPIDCRDYRVLGNLRLAALDDLLVSAIRNSFLAEGLSVKRVNNLMAPLRGAIERQCRLKRLALNPFDLVQPLRRALAHNRTGAEAAPARLDLPLPGDNVPGFCAAEGEPDPLTPDELKAVLSFLAPAMARQILFACWTGLRTGEVIALRVSDLQLDHNRFLVRRSLSRGILKTPKTDKQRWVQLLPPARAALEAQLMGGTADGWVFPNPFTHSRWANDSKITRRWKTALAQAGVRYRRPYQTRHTYASLMLSAGENPLYVAQQMGHADWSMLVKVYARWMPAASAQTAGSLVAAAHARSWRDLLAIIAAPSA